MSAFFPPFPPAHFLTFSTSKLKQFAFMIKIFSPDQELTNLKDPNFFGKTVYVHFLRGGRGTPALLQYIL